MSIVVTTPTGNVGARLTSHLLDAGEQVTLVARHPDKVAAHAQRGAKVVQGSQTDAAFMVEATRGAETLFWVTPPDSTTSDLRGHQNRLGQIAAEAINANRIARVVNLSSTGAHQSAGTGPVKGLHDVEVALDATQASITHLRPTFFMENLLMSVPTMRGAGSIFMPVTGTVRVPMVATRDIAAAAADCVRDRSWSGRRVLHLYGPRELTFDEVAAIIGRALSHPVHHVRVTSEQAKTALTGLGLSENVAAMYVELYEALESGLLLAGLTAEPELRGRTSFEEFALDMLARATTGEA